MAAIASRPAAASAAVAVAAASRSAIAASACSTRFSAASSSSERCIMSTRTASTESSFWVSTFSTFFARCSRSVELGLARVQARLELGQLGRADRAALAQLLDEPVALALDTCWRWRPLVLDLLLERR